MDFTKEISNLLDNQNILQQRLIHFEQQLVNITKSLKNANLNKTDNELLLKALKVVNNNITQCKKLLSHNTQEAELLGILINKYDNYLEARKAKQINIINAFIQGKTHKLPYSTLCVAAAA
jgi:hypothetical protein